MHCIVVHVVQELQSVIAHQVWFLRDRGINRTALNPVQSLWIVVKRHDCNFPFHVHAMQRVGHACPAGRLEANYAIDLGLLAENRRDSVVCLTRIALVIDGLDDLDARRFLERIRYAVEALVKVELSRNCDDYHRALTLENSYHTPAAFLTSSKIVRANKHDTLRFRSVG